MTDLHRLPDGWDWVKIEDVADVIPGNSPPSSTYNDSGDGLPFYQGKSEFGDLYPTPEKWCSEPKKIAEQDDVLVSVRAPVGPTNLCPDRSCIGRGLAAIRPRDDTSPRYVLWAIRARERQLSEMGTGTTFDSVTSEELRSFKIPLAPGQVRNSIVAKIEEHFSNLQAGLKSLKTAERQLGRYRLSVLQAAVEGRLTAEWRRTHNPEPADQLLETILEERREQWEERYRWDRYESKGKEPPSGWKDRYREPERLEFDEDLEELPEGWLWTSLGYICEMTSGGTPKRSNDDYFGGEIAWLKSGELNDDVITDAEESITEKGFQESSTVLFPKGTLLVALYGATTGKLGILDFEAATNQAICGLYVPPSLSTRYLFWYLRSARSDLLGRRFGGAQKNLSQTILKTIPVPLPPLREQEQIVGEIERTLSVADDLRSSLSNNVRRSNRLRQSILKYAFSGRLTQS